MKRVLGRLAAVAYPALTREVRAGNIGGPKHRMKRLIARAELNRLEAQKQRAAVEHALTRRWTSENLPVGYYDAYAERFERMFHGPHARIIDWLQDFAPRAGLTHVIEVGCGEGRVLAEMSRQIPGIARWTGVDINAAIIARNRDTYAGMPALDFAAADADQWLQDHLGPGALLMTYGGVMEYIAPETLTRWFELVAEKGGAGVLLTEPVDPDHDLIGDPASHLWGFEETYSHNHRALLEALGYRVLRRSRVTSEGYRWIMILAAPETTGQTEPRVPADLKEY